MTKLSVNLNKVATLRNTRTIGIPSPLRAAHIALEAGADGITLHPRPDKRHIVPRDVYEIAELMQEYPDAELNIEGNPFHGLMEFIPDIRPAQCTLVPDAPDTFTSDHGWEVEKNHSDLQKIISQLHDYGCRVSLFMDADSEEWSQVAGIGADRVELYTEPYAAAFSSEEGGESLLDTFAGAARRAAEVGLGVNAGHDLNLDNLGPFLERVEEVAEVSIGHALIADALEYGMSETVRMYLAVIEEVTGWENVESRGF